MRFICRWRFYRTCQNRQAIILSHRAFLELGSSAQWSYPFCHPLVTSNTVVGWIRSIYTRTEKILPVPSIRRLLLK
ncbi:hypothetical protein AX14_008099 [Amanita brunnescens Koide BX004]|nr:hypothetical protein AX14_008099 [Amanita brunnescens Koide BX004]